MDVSGLPTLNAMLNTLSAFFLLGGLYFIKQKKIKQHRIMMISAFLMSVLFLISYLTYHFSTHLLTTFKGDGFWRLLYFGILISHSILATIVPVLAIITLIRGIKMNVEQHRKIARWTFPIWLYVSVTGVVVYFMLYHWFA